MFYRKRFFCSKRDLRVPSADCREILPHDRNLTGLYNAGRKIWGPKKGQRHAKFDATSDIFKLWPQTSLEGIKNRKSKFFAEISPMFSKEVWCVNWEMPKSTFSKNHISVPAGLWNFYTCYRRNDQVLLAHTPLRMGVPQQFLWRGSKIGSIVSVFAPTTLTVEDTTPQNFATWRAARWD